LNRSAASERRGSLPELALLFLRLGTTAFGGPAAHIALMRQEVVERRQWMTDAEFLDLLGAANLIPGPNSTELAIHIGYQRGGWPGLLLAGSCFILPAALIVSAFAWAYARFRSLPEVAGVLYAVKPVVVAVVLQAIWGLARPALKNRLLTILGTSSLILALLGADELLLLFGAGTLAGAIRWMEEPWTGPRWQRARPLFIMLLAAGAMAGLPALLTRALPVSQDLGPHQAVTFGLTPLFLFFLKVGAVLYGSGYVLLAFLRDGLVSRWRWLTSAQLLDAVAVGQVTPGPVFTTATFVGYILGGPWGAVTATLGIFLPSFLFVAASGPLVPRIRKSPIAGAFLDGVNAAALALMIAVTLQIARAALVDWLTILLAASSAILLVRFKVNSAWLILAAATLGIAATFAGLR
jgi:chromate transporter